MRREFDEFFSVQTDHQIDNKIKGLHIPLIKDPEIALKRSWVVKHWNTNSTESILKTIDSCYLAEDYHNLHCYKLPELRTFI